MFKIIFIESVSFFETDITIKAVGVEGRYCFSRYCCWDVVVAGKEGGSRTFTPPDESCAA